MAIFQLRQVNHATTPTLVAEFRGGNEDIIIKGSFLFIFYFFSAGPTGAWQNAVQRSAAILRLHT